MHRWIASAAGGTSQRLKPGLAMVRSRDSSPDEVVVLAADIIIFPLWVPNMHSPLSFGYRTEYGSAD